MFIIKIRVVPEGFGAAPILQVIPSQIFEKKLTILCRKMLEYILSFLKKKTLWHMVCVLVF